MRSVSVSRPLAPLLGALLAFVAVIGMTALSSWHGATVQIGEPAHAVSVIHVHGDRMPADPDAAIHVAAHMAGEGMNLPGVSVARPYAAAADRLWLPASAVMPEALAPPSLLRPPRV